MADDVDIANDRAQQSLDLAISAARRSGAYIQPNGQCYNCEAPLPCDLRFCDTNCRDDYQARQPR